MSSNKTPLLAVACCLLLGLLGGCDQPPQPAAARPEKQLAEAAPAALFRQPIAADTLELPTEAIPIWRQFRSQQPALVLFSFDPLLHDFPPQLEEQIEGLIDRGSAAQFRQYGSYYRANPLLLPPQTVRAALHSGLFSALYWVYPQADTPMTLEDFQQLLKQSKILRPAERAALRLTNGRFTTLVDGIPLQALPVEALPQIDRPLLLHIDLGYFANSYRNEIKTPIYQLLQTTGEQLRRTGWQPLAVTLSASTGEGLVKNDFRFLLGNLQTLLAQPELLDRAPPKEWQLRASALYQTAMYQPDQARQSYRQLAELAPEQAASHYDLFRNGSRHTDAKERIEQLDRAVALDPGYFWSYIDLAAEELKAKRLPAAIELLQKALAAAPQNSITRFELAKRLVEAGQLAEAEQLLKQLRALNWSPLYHPEFPPLIEQLEQQLASRKNTAP